MSDVPITSVTVLIGRMFWTLVGPVFLALSLLCLVTASTGWLTFADLLYFLILGGILLGRWAEVRSGNPQTTTGEPATPADLRRYFVAVIVGGPVLWVVANLIGKYVLHHF